jgi:hypothetical protein
MIVELGFTDTEFIAINKLVGVAALIVGSALARRSSPGSEWDARCGFRAC